MNNVTQLLPPGTNPQHYVQLARLRARIALCADGRRELMTRCRPKFQRRYHKGLQFLVSLHAERLEDQRRRLAVGRRRRRAPRAGRRPATISRTTSVSPASTRSTPSSSAATTTCPATGRGCGGWRTNWVLSLYSGQAQTINCSRPRAAPGTGCYALVVGDPYAGAHDVNQFYNPAAFADPAPVATIGQTDFSPLGGPRSQVTGPPLRQLDMGFARQIRVAVRSSSRSASRSSTSRTRRRSTCRGR